MNEFQELNYSNDMIKLFKSNVFSIIKYIILNTITKIIGTTFIVEWKDYEGLPTFFFKF